MSKELPLEALIELAKKAPKVLPELEGASKKSNVNKNATPFTDFMSATGLKPGRNPIKNEDIYNLYCQWTNRPLSRKTFGTTLSDYFKKSGSQSHKYNMKLITLEEIIKKLLYEKKEQEKP